MIMLAITFASWLQIVTPKNYPVAYLEHAPVRPGLEMEDDWYSRHGVNATDKRLYHGVYCLFRRLATSRTSEMALSVNHVTIHISIVISYLFTCRYLPLSARCLVGAPCVLIDLVRSNSLGTVPWHDIH